MLPTIGGFGSYKRGCKSRENVGGIEGGRKRESEGRGEGEKKRRKFGLWSLGVF